MTSHPQPESARPLSAARIDADVFDEMRRVNLARWPTGAEVDIDEAVAFHKSLPKHKQLGWVMRKADAEGRCLTQPRGGFATVELQKELMHILDKEGHADIVPTTTDSYTRNEQWENAARGVEESKKAGRSMLNGYAMVNYGPKATRQLIEAINKPAIVLSGTSMPRAASPEHTRRPAWVQDRVGGITRRVDKRDVGRLERGRGEEIHGAVPRRYKRGGARGRGAGLREQRST